jgi:hypothetical protein
MCSPLKENSLFKKCQPFVDPTSFIDNCKNDICDDSNSASRELYRCLAFAAYAHECADKGVKIDWFQDAELAEIASACINSKVAYGKCSGGSYYDECPKQENTTCRDLANTNKASNHQETFCAAGCVCPEDYYFDTVGSQAYCVPKDSCPCYDKATNQYFKNGEKFNRGCSPW